jgi:hypothetical protein
MSKIQERIEAYKRLRDRAKGFANTYRERWSANPDKQKTSDDLMNYWNHEAHWCQLLIEELEDLK